MDDVMVLADYAFGERRRKDASKRLVAGVIGEYGVPGRRMLENYRRWARDTELVGRALRCAAAARGSVVVHCEQGKDRTGVVCAVAQRLAGVSRENITADYLAYNAWCARDIAVDAERLGRGMTRFEKAILMSFLEAREEYLDAFRDEIDAVFGSFDVYVLQGLGLSAAQIDALTSRIWGSLSYRRIAV